VDLTGAAGVDGTAAAGPAEAAVLYILACPLPGGDDRPAYLLHAVGGVDCVLGYTDLDRLAECCGPHQPWLAVRMDALMSDLRAQHLPGPVVNLPLRSGARWTADGPPRDLRELMAAGRSVGGTP
jgi:hypothetical protein